VHLYHVVLDAYLEHLQAIVASTPDVEGHVQYLAEKWEHGLPSHYVTMHLMRFDNNEHIRKSTLLVDHLKGTIDGLGATNDELRVWLRQELAQYPGPEKQIAALRSKALLAVLDIRYHNLANTQAAAKSALAAAASKAPREPKESPTSKVTSAAAGLPARQLAQVGARLQQQAGALGRPCPHHTSIMGAPARHTLQQCRTLQAMPRAIREAYIAAAAQGNLVRFDPADIPPRQSHPQAYVTTASLPQPARQAFGQRQQQQGAGPSGRRGEMPQQQRQGHGAQSPLPWCEPCHRYHNGQCWGPNFERAPDRQQAGQGPARSGGHAYPSPAMPTPYQGYHPLQHAPAPHPAHQGGGPPQMYAAAAPHGFYQRPQPTTGPPAQQHPGPPPQQYAGLPPQQQRGPPQQHAGPQQPPAGHTWRGAPAPAPAQAHYVAEPQYQEDAWPEPRPDYSQEAYGPGGDQAYATEVASHPRRLNQQSLPRAFEVVAQPAPVYLPAVPTIDSVAEAALLMRPMRDDPKHQELVARLAELVTRLEAALLAAHPPSAQLQGEVLDAARAMVATAGPKAVFADEPPPSKSSMYRLPAPKLSLNGVDIGQPHSQLHVVADTACTCSVITYEAARYLRLPIRPSPRALAGSTGQPEVGNWEVDGVVSLVLGSSMYPVHVPIRGLLVQSPKAGDLLGQSYHVLLSESVLKLLGARISYGDECMHLAWEFTTGGGSSVVTGSVDCPRIPATLTACALHELSSPVLALCTSSPAPAPQAPADPQANDAAALQAAATALQPAAASAPPATAAALQPATAAAPHVTMYVGSHFRIVSERSDPDLEDYERVRTQRGQSPEQCQPQQRRLHRIWRRLDRVHAQLPFEPQLVLDPRVARLLAWEELYDSRRRAWSTRRHVGARLSKGSPSPVSKSEGSKAPLLSQLLAPLRYHAWLLGQPTPEPQVFIIQQGPPQPRPVGEEEQEAAVPAALPAAAEPLPGVAAGLPEPVASEDSDDEGAAGTHPPPETPVGTWTEPQRRRCSSNEVQGPHREAHEQPPPSSGDLRQPQDRQSEVQGPVRNRPEAVLDLTGDEPRDLLAPRSSWRHVELAPWPANDPGAGTSYAHQQLPAPGAAATSAAAAAAAPVGSPAPSASYVHQQQFGHGMAPAHSLLTGIAGRIRAMDGQDIDLREDDDMAVVWEDSPPPQQPSQPQALALQPVTSHLTRLSVLQLPRLPPQTHWRPAASPEEQLPLTQPMPVQQPTLAMPAQPSAAAAQHATSPSPSPSDSPLTGSQQPSGAQPGRHQPSSQPDGGQAWLFARPLSPGKLPQGSKGTRRARYRGVARMRTGGWPTMQLAGVKRTQPRQKTPARMTQQRREHIEAPPPHEASSAGEEESEEGEEAGEVDHGGMQWGQPPPPGGPPPDPPPPPMAAAPPPPPPEPPPSLRSPASRGSQHATSQGPVATGTAAPATRAWVRDAGALLGWLRPQPAGPVVPPFPARGALQGLPSWKQRINRHLDLVMSMGPDAACSAPVRAARPLRRPVPGSPAAGVRWATVVLVLTLAWVSPAVGMQPPPPTGLQQHQYHAPHELARSLGVGSLLAAARTTPLQDILPIDPGDGPMGRFTKDPDHLWSLCHHPGTTPAQQQQFAAMLREMRRAFAHTTAELTGYKGEGGDFRIEVDMSRPEHFPPKRKTPALYRPQRLLSAKDRAIIDEKCNKMLQANIIEECPLSDYAAHPVLAAKRDPHTGLYTDFRFALDYRPVNSVTIQDRYSTPFAEQLLRWAGGKPFITTMDLCAGFHQIPLAPEHRHITAFWWGNKLYQFTRMPFGLKNATAHFQRVMDRVLGDPEIAPYAKAFVDDIIIATNTYEEHIKVTRKVLAKLHSVGLCVHPEKSVFCADVVEFLGVNLSAKGLQVAPAKASAIKAMQPPRNVSELRSALGTLNFCRAFAPNYSTIVAPLNHLLRANVTWDWGARQQEAFDQIKQALCRGVMLHHLKPGRPIKVYTDFSNLGIGALMTQVNDEGVEELCLAISRSLNKAEANYSSWEGEMLAAVWAIKSLKQYVDGQHFTVVTDNQPLAYLTSHMNLDGKHARWALTLQAFSFDIQHRPGTVNPADYPSRRPQATTRDSSGARIDQDPNPPTPIATAHHTALDTYTLWQACPPSALALATSASPRKASSQQRAAWEDSQLMHAVAGPRGAECSAVPYTADDGLAGNQGRPYDMQVHPAPVVEEEDAAYTAWLKERSQQWVQQVPPVSVTAPQPWVPAGPPNSDGICPTAALCTQPVGAAVMAAGAGRGIVLLEPFGGLCAGLEACLRMGIRVRRYLYADTAQPAREVAHQRLQQLRARYPNLLPASAISGSLTALPQDITAISSQHLLAAGAAADQQWLVIAGWPCQDMSAAGRQQGLAGARSGTFFSLLNILGSLQQLQPSKPPGFLLENAAFDHQWKAPSAVLTSDMATIHSSLGPHIVCDAAQFGSYAHRLRAYWTNLASPEQLRAAVAGVQRAPGRLVAHILDYPRVPQVVRRADQATPSYPMYPVNHVGQPAAALPTLVATRGSYAFRDQGPGMVFDPAVRNSSDRSGALQEPNPDERERAMGYATGTTAAPGVTAAQRHTLTGNAFDMHALEGLLSIAWALQHLASAAPSPTPHASTPPSQPRAVALLSSACVRVSPGVCPVGVSVPVPHHQLLCPVSPSFPFPSRGRVSSTCFSQPLDPHRPSLAGASRPLPLGEEPAYQALVNASRLAAQSAASAFVTTRRTAAAQQAPAGVPAASSSPSQQVPAAAPTQQSSVARRAQPPTIRQAPAAVPAPSITQQGPVRAPAPSPASPSSRPLSSPSVANPGLQPAGQPVTPAVNADPSPSPSVAWRTQPLARPTTTQAAAGLSVESYQQQVPAAAPPSSPSPRPVSSSSMVGLAPQHAAQPPMPGVSSSSVARPAPAQPTTASPGPGEVITLGPAGRQEPVTAPAPSKSPVATPGPNGGNLPAQSPTSPRQPVAPEPADSAVLAEAAEAADAPFAGSLDILEDQPAMHYLQHASHLEGMSAAEQRRVVRRAAAYVYAQGLVWRVMADGTRRLVPQLDQRQPMVVRAHQDSGHWGSRRVVSLLAHTHWWRGMHADASAVSRNCTECGRNNATFGTQPPQLNSLPIRGLFYRWGVDLAGPLPRSSEGNLYVMLCIDHFSKHLTAVPLPDKSAATTSRVFRQHVLGVYGAPAEVLTDQGTEFRDEFHALCVASFIDHRTTSAYHPQANGLAERAVQSVKRALGKLAHRTPKDWDIKLPYVVLGYNCSMHKSTGVTPYQLLHAVPPIVPPAVRPRFNPPIDLDDPVLLAQSLLERGEALEAHLVMAGANQLIAQHRDQLHYAKTRAGAYNQQVTYMPVGSYVYVKRMVADQLQLKSLAAVYRVVEVRESGVMVVEGQCGSRINVHVSHCAPCHAEIRDERVYPMLARPDKELACEVCNRPDREGSMLLCDGCGTGWHLDCLSPPLPRVPDGMWVCPMCAAAGVDASTLPEPVEPEVEPLAGEGEPLPQLEVLRYCPVGRHLARNGQRVWGSVVEDGAVRDCIGVLTYLGHLGKEARYRLRYEGGAGEEELSLAAVKVLRQVGEAPAPAPAVAGASRGRVPALHRPGPRVAVGQAHHAAEVHNARFVVDYRPTNQYYL
jgi:hypothetical protein